ncbi:hypothetical protein [Erwinia pyrifoliae]|uniref:Uncharacterized protein n=1 Tax=Erwinia pyrifoliae TaxID=79967 RepID=A0ABY5X990_ERWPY|nr:hypothetical protein [Erwinia pyrifoliae]AUX74315.1 hypothetical protein CPI84_18800 [Erwinia pyrifoliae]MCA8875328.1 hypothetical protein [Erwinia pyrifoliae]UWS33710.1 hypothetical protein NYP84_00280 [Erwinia pyrifoliae]CAX53819.1 uncharcterized protein [Erwinia pyrifoliae Ep1/96]CAY72353.1 hypothetical protein EPYR_00063 [Erwinia pyrifoliae DSM 12163]
MRNAPAITAPSPAERLENVRHDAAMTARYAAELKALFDCHLDARLREANPKAGARFWTLIHELYSAAGRTQMRLDRMEIPQ